MHRLEDNEVIPEQSAPLGMMHSSANGRDSKRKRARELELQRCSQIKEFNVTDIKVVIYDLYATTIWQ